MTEFDPCADKTYAMRLADLGENKEVIASEDILNDQGALLVKKGARINQQMSDRIIRFKLLKPIESSIDITNSLSPQELYRCLIQDLTARPELLQIHTGLGLERDFKRHSLNLSRFPILRQKLTVMREQMPRLFQQTLCVCWLTLAIMKQLELGEDEQEEGFMAALAHDIGMMHIDPTVLDKQEQLTSMEWRQIQAHTVIGQKVLESIPQLNKRVARIVLEHHERCDGTGYPLGKFAEQLTIESQIIALCDSVYMVLSKPLNGNGRRLRDLLPFIQVNSESHFYRTYTGLVRVIKMARLDDTCHIEHHNIDEAVLLLEQRNDELGKQLQALELIVSNISEENNHKLLQSSATILMQISKIVRGSGILDPGYLRWLQQVRQDKLDFAYRETADAVLMLEEIEWHLKRIVKILNQFLEHGPDTELQIKQLIRETLPQPEPQVKLEDYAIS
ncbi:MAG: hypothetical protein CML06_18045 [Pseudomonadales bacterium]|nr:hypothetical protein [Pseudomonadales bacterium]